MSSAPVCPRWTKRSLRVLVSRAWTRKRRETPSTLISPGVIRDRPRLAPDMERVGEHSVPAGPLAARWLAYELGEARAGVPIHARLRLENAGSAPWRSRGTEGIQLSYHWLDPLGNPIEWDGVRAPLPRVVEPGEEIELEATVRAPRPPGGYRLAFDLVEEHRFWFQELGSTPLDLPVEVRPRIDERRLRVVVHGGPDPETESALAGPGRADRRRRTRSRSRISSPEPCPPPTGRACCSTPMRRGTRRSAARWRSKAASAPARERGRSPPGRPAAGGTRASTTRCSFRPCSKGSSRRARRPAGVLGAGRALRRSRRRQTSTAIRSSERLKTNAPSASATSGCDHRVDAVRDAPGARRRRARRASPRSAA